MDFMLCNNPLNFSQMLFLRHYNTTTMEFIGQIGDVYGVNSLRSPGWNPATIWAEPMALWKIC